MRRRAGSATPTSVGLVSTLLVLALAASAGASTAYGTINNFDCVNDTGVEAHGFEIELDDIRSTDITYTYDYNHYGVPKITEDLSDPAHPRVFVRYAATKNPDGTWSAYTAIPTGPISPTDGHQFTNPSVNFGGEHFGVGYFAVPTAVKYNWLIDVGGTLAHGPPVYVATPTFAYAPPAAAQPAQVQAVIVPPPPPAPPVLQFGEATWVKQIKTTTHNANKVELTDLVDPDPDNPAAHDWRNGEPDQVETEWKLLQTEFANAANPKGFLEGAPEDLPGGDEVITRRYEFYKYTGPLDAESGEGMADAVGADGIHGVGSVTYNDHFDPDTGEWVTVTVDLSTVVVVGDFIGAQMAGFDVAPALGLIDHIPDGELTVAYADRSVVVTAGSPFHVVTTGTLPPGTTLGELTGVFSGTPTTAGAYTFTVDVSDEAGASVTKTYTVTIPAADGGGPPPTWTVSTSASPAAGGTTAGGGAYADGTPITVIATHADGHAFVNWTEGGMVVATLPVYPFTVAADRTLVANFVVVHTVTTSASPAAGGTTSGGGAYETGVDVTVSATAAPGYAFVHWTEGGTVVSASASFTFSASVDRALVAVFVARYTVTTSASPAAFGTTSGDGTFDDGSSVTVTATANAGYVFVHWTEGATVVSTSATYAFTLTADRALVAAFVPTRTVTTSASPSTQGATAGDGTYGEGSSVTVTATPNAGYVFVNWTEGASVVSTSAAYTFTVAGDRTLVAHFLIDAPVLSIASATATWVGHKVDVTVTLANAGGAAATSAAIDAKKDATLGGKGTQEHPPVALGDVASGGTATFTLTFAGIKAGTRTLQVKVTYAGGTTTLTVDVVVP